MHIVNWLVNTGAVAWLGAAVSFVCLVTVTRRVRMQQNQLTTSAAWPPPFAADKGVKQDLSISGFAFTYGNGCAFVHMRPVLHFGPGAQYKALAELKRRLELAHGRASSSELGLVREELDAVYGHKEVAVDFFTDDEQKRLAELDAALKKTPLDQRERAQALIRETIRAKAAAQGDQLCDKHDPATGLPCIEDFEHDGECVFPRFQTHEPAPVPEGKKQP